MPDYDFHQLTWQDLEVLTRDLLQAHWNVTIENFKAGRDGGIDLRYAVGPHKIIIQVKHYRKTGLGGLLRELRKEAEKVRKIKPTRYVLVTSVPLSPPNKSEIIGIIGEDILCPDDVVGQEGLNNLLGIHPKVESQHFKLWLASKAVLDRVLHNAAVTRSEFKVQQVYDEARRYVQSDAYPRAMKMLNEQRVVIIAGPPGVGKTTLANLLLYAHLDHDYQAVVIQRDIDEGQSLFQRGANQIFYFDDFMGATFLGEQSSGSIGTKDRSLLDFVALVRATPTARLILTTREHIYTQAMNRSERLRNSELDDLRVFLSMPDYSFEQKARILYNHLYFSDLPYIYQDELLQDSFYLRIIRHKKFNPRLIEWLSSYRRIRNVPVEHYQTFVENLLRDPLEIWQHAYEQEITDAGRSMLLAVFSLEGKVGEVLLKPAFNALHLHRAKRYGFAARPEDYRSALREVAGTFIKPFGTNGVEVIDPSVLDLLNAVVQNNPQNAIDILIGATSFDQLDRLWTLATSAKLAGIVDALRHHHSELADCMQRRMVEDRMVWLEKGAYGYKGATFERRLKVAIEMADRLASTACFQLIEPAFTRLQKEWETERPNINDAVELIRTINASSILSTDQQSQMTVLIQSTILTEVQSGCRSDELREIVCMFDTKAPANVEMVAIAHVAFDAYRQNFFSDEVHECRSREEFEGLIEDLELFRDELGVDVEGLIDAVVEAQSEFEEREEAYADYMQDTWKEQRYFERDGERGVREMFSSLKNDRDN